MAHHDHRLPTCANCGFDFVASGGPDEFCPRCGQQNQALDLSIGHVVEEVLEGIFHFDGKVFRTARLLLTQPGQLTRQFLLGHRAPYVPPVRLYIFISFVFFFLLSLQVGHDRKQVLKQVTKNMREAETVRLSAADSIKLAQAGLPTAARRIALDSAHHFNVQVPTQANQGGLSLLGNSLQMSADELERLPTEPSAAQIDSVIKSKGQQPGWLNRLALRRTVRWREATSEDISHQLVRAASILAFFLMPLAALLLKLGYARRHLPYLSHLIFTVHVQCFLFLLFSVITALQLLHAPKWLSNGNVVFSLIGIYFILALRRVYQQSWPKTILKSVLLSMAYGITLMLTLLAVGVIGVAFF